MSTGLECQIVEYRPGQWYYVLENWDAPKMSWDWREYATAYGPFSSEARAQQHLSDHHANPGGWWVVGHTDMPTQDAVMDRLVEEARR